jgi:hypothetical protein
MNKSDRPAQVSASAALLRRAPGAVINGGVAIKTVPGGAELAMPPMSYIVFEKP